MRDERSRKKLLRQAAERLAIGAHAPLFRHYIALLVELAHHRVQEALRFQKGPQLNAICGERVEVDGLIVRGSGVHSDLTLLIEHLGKGVIDHVFVRLFGCVLPCLPKLSQLLFVKAGPFPELVVVSRESLFDFFQRHLFRRPVGRADGRCTLKGHMLHHVRQASESFRVLHRTGIDQREERKYRSFRSFHHHQGQTIRELVDSDALFKRGKVLSGRNTEKSNVKEEDKQQTSGYFVGCFHCQLRGIFKPKRAYSLVSTASNNRGGSK